MGQYVTSGPSEDQPSVLAEETEVEGRRGQWSLGIQGSTARPPQAPPHHCSPNTHPSKQALSTLVSTEQYPSLFQLQTGHHCQRQQGGRRGRVPPKSAPERQGRGLSSHQGLWGSTREEACGRVTATHRGVKVSAEENKKRPLLQMAASQLCRLWSGPG